MGVRVAALLLLAGSVAALSPGEEERGRGLITRGAGAGRASPGALHLVGGRGRGDGLEPAGGAGRAGEVPQSGHAVGRGGGPGPPLAQGMRLVLVRGTAEVGGRGEARGPVRLSREGGWVRGTARLERSRRNTVRPGSRDPTRQTQ